MLVFYIFVRLVDNSFSLLGCFEDGKGDVAATWEEEMRVLGRFPMGL